MAKDCLAFVMVGHVDHGKSTMIGRMLCDSGSLSAGKMEEIEAAARAAGKPVEFGFIIDHLREERERGMTIDTAQTFFASPTRDYAIIDAPGHKEFIKNMITGASQAEAAVLICSVAEGIQEQTKRHAYLVRLLGLEQIIIAYNKMDAVGYRQDRFQQLQQEMHSFLELLSLKPLAEVPISAREGDNVVKRSNKMPWYKGPTVLEALDHLSKLPAPIEKPLRFPVQDVYEFLGPEKVVVGRVESGRIHKGQRLVFVPGHKYLTVSGIRQYPKGDLLEAEAGECVGLVLNGDGLQRGQVGCLEDAPITPTRSFHASLFWMSERPFQTAEPQTDLLFRCATQEQPCRIASILERMDSSTLERLPTHTGILEHTEVGDVVIETTAPVAVEPFYEVQELGRFVIVQGRDVVAGGIVTRTR